MTGKVEYVTKLWEVGTTSRAFQTILVVQEVGFFSTKTKNIKSVLMISSCKKLNGKQHVDALKTVHTFFGKIRPDFLGNEFLKGRNLQQLW